MRSEGFAWDLLQLVGVDGLLTTSCGCIYDDDESLMMFLVCFGHLALVY